MRYSKGLYVFDPGAFGPQCGTVKLVLYSEKEPEKGETRIVDPNVVQQIWQDFAPYRGRRTDLRRCSESRMAPCRPGTPGPWLAGTLGPRTQAAMESTAGSSARSSTWSTVPTMWNVMASRTSRGHVVDIRQHCAPER